MLRAQSSSREHSLLLLGKLLRVFVKIVKAELNKKKVDEKLSLLAWQSKFSAESRCHRRGIATVTIDVTCPDKVITHVTSPKDSLQKCRLCRASRTGEQGTRSNEHRHCSAMQG